MWKLVIEDDEGKRTVVPLTRDDYTIGRKEGNTIRLTERNVSRDHAKLSRKANGAPPPPTPAPTYSADRPAYVLEDLTSYNGVYVNGLRVAHSQELQHGDLVQIGDYRIVLQDDALTEQPPTAPPITDPKSTMPTGAHRQASNLMERPNRLVMLAGPTPGAEYPLEQERMTIGRAEDASISINHNSVSRLHCEIHALGDGRYEIVDKGSSNGVRVNSAELRRGIIEAGDVIELGDVKFKFVGAGQIFRPGATESQQLAAIGERAAAQIVGKRRSSVLPVVIFLIVVAVGGAAAFYVTRGKPLSQQPTGTSPVASSSDQTTLDKAKALCPAQPPDRGPVDCDPAHDVLSTLPKDSAVRSTKDYKDIETWWANAEMARADDASLDQDTREGMLKKVIAASELDAIDPRLRKTATKLLNDLDTGASSTDELPRAASDAGLDAGLHKHFDAGAFRFDAAAPASTDSAHPPTAGNLDSESQAVLNGQTNSARASLQSRVYSGQASAAETMLLRSLCREQGDKTCVATCNSLLQPKPAPSH